MQPKPSFHLASLFFVIFALCSCSESLPPCDTRAATDVSTLTAPAPLDEDAPYDTPRYSLQEAVSRGLVDYEIRGNGNSSGDSLTMTMRRLSFSAIDVYIVPGTIFVSGNANAQRMVGWRVVGVVELDQKTYETTSMYLPDTIQRTFVIEAYCLDFRRDNPSASDVFITSDLASSVAVADTLDLRAAQIIAEGKKRNLTIAGLQSAIWVDHEGISRKELETKFSAADGKDLDDAFNFLQTLPPPDRLGAGRQTVKCRKA